MAILRLVKILSRYGKTAVNYVWNHRGLVNRLLTELGVAATANWILDRLHIHH